MKKNKLKFYKNNKIDLFFNLRCFSSRDKLFKLLKKQYKLWKMGKELSLIVINPQCIKPKSKLYEFIKQVGLLDLFFRENNQKGFESPFETYYHINGRRYMVAFRAGEEGEVKDKILLNFHNIRYNKLKKIIV